MLTAKPQNGNARSQYGVTTFAPLPNGGPGPSGLQIATVGNGYTLKATWTPPNGGSGTLTAGNSQKFNVGVQRQNSTFDMSTPPKQLTFALRFDPSTKIPASFPIGQVLPPITLTLMGTDGKVLANDSTDRISLVTGGLFGTLTQTAVNGKVTFNDLVFGPVSGLDAATTKKILDFIYADLPLGGISSSPITLQAGKAAGLAFVAAGGAITTQPTPVQS